MFTVGSKFHKDFYWTNIKIIFDTLVIDEIYGINFLSFQ